MAYNLQIMPSERPQFSNKEKQALAFKLKNHERVIRPENMLTILAGIEQSFGRLDFAAIDDVLDTIQSDVRLIALLTPSGERSLASVIQPKPPERPYAVHAITGGRQGLKEVLSLLNLTATEHQERLSQAGIVSRTIEIVVAIRPTATGFSAN